MRLAVLLDAESEALEPPIFGLADGPALIFDDCAEFLHQPFDLLRGDVLARQEHMLIKRHGLPFLRFGSGAYSHGPWKERPKKTTLGSGDRGDRLLPAASRSGSPFSLRPERFRARFIRFCWRFARAASAIRGRHRAFAALPSTYTPRACCPSTNRQGSCRSNKPRSLRAWR